MTPKLSDKPVETALAAHIPPLECDHREALALLNAIPAREQTDEQAETLVRLYRETRRKDAAKRLERERKRNETAGKKAEAHARRLEREAKRAEKLSSKAAVRVASEVPDQASEKGE